MLIKIKNILSRDLIQKLLYLFGLILWTTLFWDNIVGGGPHRAAYSKTIYGIDLLTIYIIPATILGLQILINNKILWALIFGLFTLQMLAGLYSVLTNLTSLSDDIGKGFELLTYYTVIGIVDWTIFQMKPTNLLFNYSKY